MSEKPKAPEAGWAPESEMNPYVDGLPIMAWVSWRLSSAGFCEEDGLAGLFVEATAIARGGHYDRGLLLSILPSAVDDAVALKARPPEPSLREALGKWSDNVPVSQVGWAMRAAMGHSRGDDIDGGLALIEELGKAGFEVVPTSAAEEEECWACEGEAGADHTCGAISALATTEDQGGA